MHEYLCEPLIVQPSFFNIIISGLGHLPL